jgi:hypothetical protein
VKKRGTPSSYLIGYGLVIPLACWIPFPLLDYLQVQNKVLKMSFTTTPSIAAFRCIEAMHNTSPCAVEASLINYVTYYSSLVNQVWDAKTKTRLKATRHEILGHAGMILGQFLLLSVVLSYLLANDFKPFHSNVQLDQFHLTWDLIQPGQLANNYLLAVLTLYTLCVGFNLTGFTGNLQGYAVKDFLTNPLFHSKSPVTLFGGVYRCISLYMCVCVYVAISILEFLTFQKKKMFVF